MSRIKIEVLDKEYVLEYNRNAIIKMEEMGYNALDPTSKLLTNMEIVVYGGLLEHQPKTTWQQAIDICEAIREEYDVAEFLSTVNPMLEEVFFPGGTKKKKKKTIKVEK